MDAGGNNFDSGEYLVPFFTIVNLFYFVYFVHTYFLQFNIIYLRYNEIIPDQFLCRVIILMLATIRGDAP